MWFMELIYRTGGGISVVVFMHFTCTVFWLLERRFALCFRGGFFLIDPLILHSLPCRYSDFWVPVSKDAPVRS